MIEREFMHAVQGSTFGTPGVEERAHFWQRWLCARASMLAHTLTDYDRRCVRRRYASAPRCVQR